ncbi:MATE family efflux transporter [Bacillus smithii]|uniref:MATE family efflux transporter n=1 Tax=Bacillus smithii TaxID=1479 RepID=UPI002E234E4A|nr:MATE family efflux transporter [Bacillus smithii]MED1421320.1 MATE family efflux transporter [Bacillus smithii]MED1457239.1 MATE family efflux transporter [Bacillus smithii]MED1487992.1 MATE family efflux transporter [Bacillus smithii]
MKQYDFTSGNIMKQLVVFSTPILLTNFLQTSFQLIDSLWVGNLLGSNALGAVAVSGTVIFTVLSFIIGINNATLTILSQLKGKNDEIGLKRYVNAFVVILTFISLTLGAMGMMLAVPILKFLGTPSTMVPEAKSYLEINFAGILFLFGYNFIGTVFRALGDSRTPIRFVFFAVVLNAVLDPLFIEVWGLGLNGAAYATILSQGVSFLYGLYYSLRKRLIPFSVPRWPHRQEVSMILKLGIPAGLQMMVISAGTAAIMSVVTSFGGHVVAGFGAAQRIDSLLMLPAQALGTAVNSMAGQNIGANQWTRVRQIAVNGVLYNISIMLVIAFFVALLADRIVKLFIQQPESSVSFGAEYLGIIAFFYPFLGINFILNGIVRASGAMFQVLVLNIVSLWILRYPLTELSASYLGEKGIAFGMGASFVISSIIAFLYYRYGTWRKKQLFTERE